MAPSAAQPGNRANRKAKNYFLGEKIQGESLFKQAAQIVTVEQ
jgi:hypothetical protein